MIQSPLDRDLYGSNSEAQELLLAEQARKNQEYNDMVYAAFNTKEGKELMEYFDSYLKKPVWNVGEDKDFMMYREGSRRFIMDLQGACSKAEQG